MHLALHCNAYRPQVMCQVQPYTLNPITVPSDLLFKSLMMEYFIKRIIIWVSYCYVTNFYKFSDLKQHTLIIS